MDKKLDNKLKEAKNAGLTYERLFEIAYRMHLEIFHLVGDEKSIYDKIGLTDEENAIFGYGYIEEHISNPDIAKKLEELINNRK